MDVGPCSQGLLAGRWQSPRQCSLSWSHPGPTPRCLSCLGDQGVFPRGECRARPRGGSGGRWPAVKGGEVRWGRGRHCSPAPPTRTCLAIVGVGAARSPAGWSIMAPRLRPWCPVVGLLHGRARTWGEWARRPAYLPVLFCQYRFNRIYSLRGSLLGWARLRTFFGCYLCKSYSNPVGWQVGAAHFRDEKMEAQRG